VDVGVAITCIQEAGSFMAGHLRLGAGAGSRDIAFGNGPSRPSYYRMALIHISFLYHTTIHRTTT
jgi:hypothetical protein